MSSKFGKLFGAFLDELAKEITKPEHVRRAEEEERDRKLDRSVRRMMETLDRVATGNARHQDQLRQEATLARALEESNIDGVISFDRMKRHYLTPAIALVRPYPPHRVPAGRSHVGGVPDLPAGLPWPRDAEGEPLHFVGQVDLAEAPRGHMGGALPSAGTLLFFTAAGDELTREEVRVIYDSASAGRAVEPPEDLAPLDDAWAGKFATTGDIAPNTWPQWPWRLAAIESMPDTDAFYGRSMPRGGFQDYARQLEAFRLEQITRAAAPFDTASACWADLGIFQETSRNEPYALRPFAQTGLPWTALGVALVARALVRLCRYPRFAPFESRLREIWARAEEQPAHDPIPVEGAERLIGYLNEVLAADVKPLEHEGRENVVPGEEARRAIEAAVDRLIIESGGNPELAAALPDHLYDRGRSQHAQGAKHSQMLGYMASSQSPLSVGGSTQTLLQLVSDWGIDIVIGDCGEFDFMIEPDALARRQWDRVTVRYLGG